MLEIKAVLPVVLLLCSAIMVSRYRIYFRVQELCESRGGRPGLSALMSLTVSVDVKQH